MQIGNLGFSLAGARQRLRRLRSPSWRAVASLALVGALVVGVAQVALAVHDVGAIEMDGNLADDPAVAGTDWAALFNQSGAFSGATLPSGTVEVAHFFRKDFSVNGRGQVQADTSYFQPSTKDFQAINAAGASDVWACTKGSVADKDDIMNGYAVLVDAADSDSTNGAVNRIAYVGMERFDNSGNAFFGVWLFQSTVGCTPDGKFTGTKTVGDVLALIDFTGGGTDPANTHITAYQWVGSGGDVPGNTQFDILAGGQGCVSGQNTGDDLCAIVNTVTQDPAWDFQGKGGANLLPNQFVEAAFNLSDLFGSSAGGLPCFSTILIETRSSSSIDATLKDYLSGSFQSCRPEMATQASAAGPVLTGVTAVTDTATISVIGSTTAPDPTGNVLFSLCGPYATATACTTGGTRVGSETGVPLSGGTNASDGSATATSAAVNTSAPGGALAPGYYCFRADWAGDANYPAVSHTNATTECFQVISPTTTTTRQSAFPQDTARIAASAGGDLAGSVSFRLYDTMDNCQANGGTTATGLLFSQSATISGASPQSATTNNTTYRITVDPTTVYWNVAYSSTNPLQTGSASTCVEYTLVDFTGNDAAVTIS